MGRPSFSLPVPRGDLAKWERIGLQNRHEPVRLRWSPLYFTDTVVDALPADFGVTSDTVAVPLGKDLGTVPEIVRVVPGRTLPFHSCTVTPLREIVTRDCPEADWPASKMTESLLPRVADALR